MKDIGPTNTQEQIARLKEKRGRETDPLYRSLLEGKIKELYGRLSQESVQVLLHQDRERREMANAHRASIKCGLRNATGTAKQETAHWFWDKQSDKDAKRLTSIGNKLAKTFYVNPTVDTIRKFFLHGGVKKTLEGLGLLVVLELPEEVRKAKSETIWKLIESKLEEGMKVPYC